MKGELLVVPLVLAALAQLQEHGEQHPCVAAFLGTGLVRHLFQDLPLPLGLVDGQVVGPLVVRHLPRHIHPAQEQVQKLFIDLVDLISQFVQFHISLSPCFVFQPCVEDGDGGGGLDDGDRPGHDAWVVPALDFQCGNFPGFQIHGLLGL